MSSHSEELTTHPSLLLRVRDVRDTHAWNEFVDVYEPVIFNYCRLRQLQECDVADVTQEVLLRLSNARRRFDYKPEVGRFRDWLGMVTHREMLKFWNRRPRTQSLASTPDEEAASSALENPSLSSVQRGQVSFYRHLQKRPDPF